MSNKLFETRCLELLQSLEESGQTKPFYEIQGPMGPVVKIDGKGEIIVLCSNNYLGLADHPEVIEAGIQGLRDYGRGRLRYDSSAERCLVIVSSSSKSRSSSQRLLALATSVVGMPMKRFFQH